MDNIYANAGNVIEGERYVKRNNIETAIRRRVLDNQMGGSFALTGMQRTGKSSILHHMFLSEEKKAELLSQKRIVIDDCLATVGNASEIFLNMVKGSYRIIRKREQECDIEDLKYAYEDAMSWNVQKGSLYDILVYLEEMAALGYYLIVIMDEFDNANSLFEECSYCFNYLREIAYKSQYHTTYVTASRRMLSEISNKATKGTSPFPNIFESGFVGPFDEEEQQIYFKIFKDNYHVEIPVEEKNAFLKYSGGLAFWLDMLMKEYVERMKNGENNISVECIYEEKAFDFGKLYEKLKDLLEDQDLLHPLMQFEFGPIHSATRADRNALCNYGIVNEIEKDKYLIFSLGFKEYLYMIQGAVDFAPLWNKTERGMRRVLQKRMMKKYGGKWSDVLVEKYGEDKDIHLAESARRVRVMRRKMEGMQTKGEVNIIDMLETRPLFLLIRNEWGLMHEVFPQINVEVWAELGKRVSSMRNDFQHNNYHFRSEGSIAQNNADMTFILECIEKWEEQQAK